MPRSTSDYKGFNNSCRGNCDHELNKDSELDSVFASNFCAERIFLSGVCHFTQHGTVTRTKHTKFYKA